jgi:hypothetical protein
VAASPATASTTKMSLNVRYDLPLKGQLTQNHQMLFYREDENFHLFSLVIVTATFYGDIMTT